MKEEGEEGNLIFLWLLGAEERGERGRECLFPPSVSILQCVRYALVCTVLYTEDAAGISVLRVTVGRAHATQDVRP